MVHEKESKNDLTGQPNSMRNVELKVRNDVTGTNWNE